MSAALSLHLPAGWRSVDLLAAARTDGASDGPLGGALSAALAGSEADGVVAVLGLVTWASAEAPLVATLSVALAPPAGDHGLPDQPWDGAELAGVRLPAGPGVRARFERDVEGPGGTARVLGVQYLIDTASGVLALTFTTTQIALADEFAALFDALAARCAIELPGAQASGRAT